MIENIPTPLAPESPNHQTQKRYEVLEELVVVVKVLHCIPWTEWTVCMIS
jgi:hypothetical protein